MSQISELGCDFASFPFDDIKAFHQPAFATAVAEENAPKANNPHLVAALNEEQHLDLLKDIFYKRVFHDKTWKIGTKMPAKGKDRAFDDELERLGFANGRSKASRQWKTFC
jgi:hypothetical protein